MSRRKHVKLSGLARAHGGDDRPSAPEGEADATPPEQNRTALSSVPILGTLDDQVKGLPLWTRVVFWWGPTFLIAGFLLWAIIWRIDTKVSRALQLQEEASVNMSYQVKQMERVERYLQQICAAVAEEPSSCGG